MQCTQCHNVFQVIGDAFNSPIGIVETLERTSKILVEEFDLKGCHFRLISRDQKILEHVAAHGLSEAFLSKGPVDAERSVREALEGQQVYVADCANDPRIQYSSEFAEEGIVSMLTIPLVTRGQVIGVMRLSTKEPREFGADEVDFFNIAALFCTSAITHTMFHQILEHVTESIRSSLDLAEVMNSIVRVVAEDLRAKGCTLQILDREGKLLEVRASYGISRQFNDAVAKVISPAAAEALREGHCVPILDARNDPKIPYADEVIREQFSSMLFVPLMSRDRALGVLIIFTHHPYDFAPDEMHLMTAIGEQAALAIQNAQMYAAIKRRYESVVDEFHQWFEHYYTYPTHSQ
jgi:GAF domain-containing protein